MVRFPRSLGLPSKVKALHAPTEAPCMILQVPESSFDAIFFAAFAVIVACVAPPKWATLVCLLAGA